MGIEAQISSEESTFSSRIGNCRVIFGQAAYRHNPVGNRAGGKRQFSDGEGGRAWLQKRGIAPKLVSQGSCEQSGTRRCHTSVGVDSKTKRTHACMVHFNVHTWREPRGFFQEYQLDPSLKMYFREKKIHLFLIHFLSASMTVIKWISDCIHNWIKWAIIMESIKLLQQILWTI